MNIQIPTPDELLLITSERQDPQAMMILTNQGASAILRPTPTEIATLSQPMIDVEFSAQYPDQCAVAAGKRLEIQGMLEPFTRRES